MITLTKTDLLVLVVVCAVLLRLGKTALAWQDVVVTFGAVACGVAHGRWLADLAAARRRRKNAIAAAAVPEAELAAVLVAHLAGRGIDVQSVAVTARLDGVGDGQ